MDRLRGETALCRSGLPAVSSASIDRRSGRFHAGVPKKTL